MTTDRLQEVHEAVPFRPFTIVMGDGTRYHVPHPRYLAYSEKARTASHWSAQGRMTFLDLLLMTAIEVDPRSAHRSGGNGKNGGGKSGGGKSGRGPHDFGG